MYFFKKLIYVPDPLKSTVLSNRGFLGRGNMTFCSAVKSRKGVRATNSGGKKYIGNDGRNERNAAAEIYTGWRACPLSDAVCLEEHVWGQKVSIMGDLHGWFTAAHANEDWSRLQHEECFPAAMPDYEPDISERSFGLTHPPAYFPQRWTVICSHPENTVRFLFIFFLLHLQSQKGLSWLNAGWVYCTLLCNKSTDSSKHLWRTSLCFC